MKANISIITLGVDDLETSRKFYTEGLGWAEAESSNENVSFIRAGSVVLALYPREALAEDATVEAGARADFAGFTLAQNLASRQKVDEAMAHAKSAGATIVKPAQEVFWGGYSGYFADPDGHLWELAHNPFWVDDQGKVRLPE